MYIHVDTNYHITSIINQYSSYIALVQTALLIMKHRNLISFTYIYVYIHQRFIMHKVAYFLSRALYCIVVFTAYDIINIIN